MQDLNVEKQFAGDSQGSSVKPTPNDPPWSSAMAFLLWLISIGLIFFLPALFILPYLISKNIQISENPELTNAIIADPVAIAISLGATFAAHVLTMIAAWLVVTRYREFSFTEMLGWRWGGFKFWHGLLILIGVYAVAISLTTLLGSQENEMSKLLESSRSAVILVAIIATFSAPLVEEVIYRGVVYSAFQRTFKTPIGNYIEFLSYFGFIKYLIEKMRKIAFFQNARVAVENLQSKYHVHFAVIFVTMIFAGVHFPQYYPDYAQIISICLVSLVITIIRVKTDNLLPCIAFHLAFNGIQSAILIAQLYLPLPESLDALPENTSGIIHFVSSLTFFLI